MRLVCRVKYFLQELQRPLEVPMFGDINHWTPASVGSLAEESPMAQERWKLMPKWSQEVYHWNLEGPLEVPMEGHELLNTCWWGSLPEGDAQGLEAQAFPRGMATTVSLHMQINIVIIQKWCFWDLHVPADFMNSDTSIKALSLEQYAEGYIRPNADLESNRQTRSRQQPKFMHPEWFMIVVSQHFQYHTEVRIKAKEANSSTSSSPNRN